MDTQSRVNQAANAAAKERLQSPQTIQQPRAMRASGVDIRIFEVQSAGWGDGLYNCYEQSLDATYWGSTSGVDLFGNKNTTVVKVLNLQESFVSSSYVPALVKYDLIATWEMDDDGETSTSRRVGVPLEHGPRLVKAKASAGSDATINCNFQLRNGEYAVSGELGYSVSVTGLMSMGETQMQNCIPFVEEGKEYWAVNVRGKWMFVNNFWPYCITYDATCG